MKILFLHGWQSTPGGVKPTCLKNHGHEVLNPALPDDDFDAAVAIAQAEYERHQPDVVVGSSRGGAVAMNIASGDTPLVLLCPAWKTWGTATTVKSNTIILHSRADETVPFIDSQELVRNSSLPESALVVVGTDHRLADPEPLQVMLEAIERLGNPPQQPQWINRRRLALIPVIVPVWAVLCMFLPAGTWAWTRGWLFLLVILTAMTANALYLWHVNPELLIARSQPHKGAKRWDKILLCFAAPTLWAVVIVAALDDGRFAWFPVSWWVCGIGYALILFGMAIGTWAGTVNKFFEPIVRIQTDRGHVAINTGPYAIVRHPGYAGGIVATIGTALALGSLWALIPAAISLSLLVLRTHWEDQTLRAELRGYEQYAQRTRYRLVPGLW